MIVTSIQVVDNTRWLSQAFKLLIQEEYWEWFPSFLWHTKNNHPTYIEYFQSDFQHLYISPRKVIIFYSEFNVMMIMFIFQQVFWIYRLSRVGTEWHNVHYVNDCHKHFTLYCIHMRATHPEIMCACFETSFNMFCDPSQNITNTFKIIVSALVWLPTKQAYHFSAPLTASPSTNGIVPVPSSPSFSLFLSSDKYKKENNHQHRINYHN